MESISNRDALLWLGKEAQKQSIEGRRMTKCYVCETKVTACHQAADLNICPACKIKVAVVYAKMCGGPVKDKLLKAILEVRSTLRNEGV